MKDLKFNINGPEKRVLLAPLDWGLGHTSRCIPLIRALLEQHCEVFIGAEGPVKDLLALEFPQLNILPLQGYRVRYSRKSTWLSLKIALQFPGIMFTVYKEHRWLKKMIQEHAINAVISDNRPGLYNNSVPCIYITHQLSIKTGNRFTQWIAQKMHYHFINKYNACWVPDAAGEINLAGELSHPQHWPATTVEYLGPLSRFEKTGKEKIYDIAVVISGPEPQRTVFEKILLKELENYRGKCLMIRGLPGDTAIPALNNPAIGIHNHLSAAELNKAIERSSIVISRSGYTTVMDLVKLQQKAILVPTPGQTEQEYLAKSLAAKGYFYCIEQKDLSIDAVLKTAANFSFSMPQIDQSQYKIIIERFVAGLK